MYLRSVILAANVSTLLYFNCRFNLCSVIRKKENRNEIKHECQTSGKILLLVGKSIEEFL